MKSLQRKDFIIAGVVEKIHGTQGELRLGLDQSIQLKEWVFIEIHEKPVPFFILSVSGEADHPIIRLERVTSPAMAERFTGKNVLVPQKQSKRTTRSVDMDIEGYLLVDAVLGELGTVQHIEELPQQLLIHTTFRARELLIPVVDEFITSIDHRKRIVYLALPEGMIDL